jgi:hypothetical protein
MVKRSRKTQKLQPKPQEFIVVALTEDLEEAKDYEALLKINNIPVILREQDKTQQVEHTCIAVMVPQEFFDEAHVIVTPRDEYEEFYDLL